jgi:hypothetical protein
MGFEWDDPKGDLERSTYVFADVQVMCPSHIDQGQALMPCPGMLSGSYKLDKNIRFSSGSTGDAIADLRSS